MVATRCATVKIRFYSTQDLPTAHPFSLVLALRAMAAVGGAVPADMSELASKSGLPEDQHAHIYEAFTAFDTDKSGKIDESELGGALEAAGAKAKKVKVRAILAEMDKDGDKQIDFGEFCEVRSAEEQPTWWSSSHRSDT